MLVLFFPTTILNERKRAIIYHVLEQAEEQVNEHVDPKQATSVTNYQLIHCSGTVSTTRPVADELFSMSKKHSLRLTRRVEMLQWVEKRRETVIGDSRSVQYFYEREWKDKIVNHNDFDQQSGHENPRHMPCQSESFNVDTAFLGAFELNPTQIARLKKNRDYRPTEDERDEIIERSRDFLLDMGFTELQYKTQYFETKVHVDPSGNRPRGEPILAPGIGTVRISWQYMPCGLITVTAQQMDKENMGDHDELTFRKWNPSKIDTTMGSDNSSSTDPMCPLICIGWYIVERICFQRVFDDCIDYCCWGYKSF